MRKITYLVLLIFILAACKSQPKTIPDVTALPVLPVFLEPEFEIVSIVVIQADLINTQFESVLKIINPNNYDIQLSSLKYELFGNGMFWADGLETNILQIPAENSRETKFRFTMNFINMNRRLLDDVIAMRQIQYHFKGEAKIQPNIPLMPLHTINFEISGLSGVKPRAD